MAEPIRIGASWRISWMFTESGVMIAARPRMPSTLPRTARTMRRLSSLTFAATNVRMVNTRSASESESESVPSAESLRPVKGKRSGPRACRRRRPRWRRPGPVHGGRAGDGRRRSGKCMRTLLVRAGELQTARHQERLSGPKANHRRGSIQRGKSDFVRLTCEVFAPAAATWRLMASRPRHGSLRSTRWENSPTMRR